MVLTEGRAYSFLTVSQDQLSKGMVRQGGEGRRVDRKELSAFDAAFGKVQVPDQAPGTKVDPDAMEVDASVLAASTKLKQALFDAPSHALPPPTALASAFLRILTSLGDGKE